MQLIDPPGGHPWALIGLCGASILLNVVLVAKLASGPALPDVPITEVAPVASMEGDPADEAAGEVAAELTEEALLADVDDAVAPDGIEIIRAPVTHSLARTFQTVEPERADVIAAVYARLFFWDLDLRRDLQKGDEIGVAYQWDGELAHIPVAFYRSQKLGKTLVAYRFQASGDDYPSWWTAVGDEVPMRLKNGPLHHYEQVTSLLKDRPTHKGMDFKVPVGVDVVSPKSGTVVRTDWNWKYNGNCAEIRYNDGTIARFLHLSETTVKAGQTVGAGTVVGVSGNTGRSTAPHLHYELEKDGRVVDPVDYHGVTRRTLPSGDQTAFETEVRRLESYLASDS